MAVSLLRILSRSVTAAVLAAAAVTGVAASAQADDTPSKQYLWNVDMHAGDCTMFRGATWVVVADGTAHFDGLVTSGSNNDAWLMHAQLIGAGGKYLGNIIAQEPGVDDIGRFVQNLPDKRRQYPWHIDATYNVGKLGPHGVSEVFEQLETIHLQSHC